MTKILLVINTMGMGGAERAMIALMNALPDDAQIDLLSLINRGELFAEVPPRVRILGPKPDAGPLLGACGKRVLLRAGARALVHRLAFLRHFSYLAGNAFRQKRAGHFQADKLLWRFIADAAPKAQDEYDLAIAFLEGGATYYVANRARAKRKAAFVHVDYERAGYTRALDGRAYDKMDRIYAVSHTTADRFLRVHPEQAGKVSVFANVIDTRRILSLAETGEGFTDGFTGTRLLTIGRLHPQKGYDIAIPALKILIDKGFHARWYVLGEGMERAALEKQIAAYGLREHFILLGAKQNPYPYLRQADLYVHATRYEGKSIAIEEAQVLGKPIIATDCEGNREQILSGEDGLLIPLSVESLADALEQALREPERMRAYGRACTLKMTGMQRDVDALYAYAKGADSPA